MPSRRVGSPDPAIVFRPEMKSTPPSVGISNGSHASCVGDTWTLGLLGMKFDSMSLLSGRSVCHMTVSTTCSWLLTMLNSRSLREPQLGGLCIARHFCYWLWERQKQMQSFAQRTSRTEHILDCFVPVGSSLEQLRIRSFSPNNQNFALHSDLTEDLLVSKSNLVL